MEPFALGFAIGVPVGMIAMFLIARNNQKLAARAFGLDVSSFKRKVQEFKKVLKG